MPTGLKAIETLYRGYRMRSRTEARYAVLLEALGVTWGYESEGWDLGDGVLYLPDFLLSDLNLFIEVKGSARWLTDPLDVTKVKALARVSGRRVIVMAGDPPYPDPVAEMRLDDATAFFPNGDEDYGYWLCECQVCGRIGIEFEGRTDRLPCGCPILAGLGKGRNAASPRLRAAYAAARAARFEHGEAPMW